MQKSTWEKYSRELLSNIIFFFFYLVDIPLWVKFTLEQSFLKELTEILPPNILYILPCSNFQFDQRNSRKEQLFNFI